MAAGEYVSVSSQSDTETAELQREAAEIANDPVAETAELVAIYEQRGLTRDLAVEVAAQLMAGDPLSVHAQDELGLSLGTRARPVQAAIVSALTFSAGAAVPLAVAAVAPETRLVALVAAASLLSLATLGAVGARAGGAGMLKASSRVAFWGAFAMGVTAAVGKIVGASV